MGTFLLAYCFLDGIDLHYPRGPQSNDRSHNDESPRRLAFEPSPPTPGRTKYIVPQYTRGTREVSH